MQSPVLSARFDSSYFTRGSEGPISLETPIGEEGDSHLGDFIENRALVSPAEAVINPEPEGAKPRSCCTP